MATAAAAERLDREKLLVYRTESGRPAEVKTTADWAKRRAETLAGMREIMGPLPGAEKRVPLDVKIESETDCGTYVRREITYLAEPGARVPAFLLL
ncbi:MAG: alpha/beta hydrolase, partial [Verrucomicrobiota bacterium]